MYSLSRTYGPYGAEPGQEEGPSIWPGSKIFGIGKDIVAIVAIVPCAYWQGNDSCKYEDEVHDHKDGL